METSQTNVNRMLVAMAECLCSGQFYFRVYSVRCIYVNGCFRIASACIHDLHLVLFAYIFSLVGKKVAVVSFEGI